MRVYARWRTFKRLWLDDAFVAFAWLLALLTAIDWQIVAKLAYRFQAVVSGKFWPPPDTFEKDTENYFKGTLVVLVFFFTSLWAIKLSFLMFFQRLGQNVTGQKKLWWCVFSLTVATYLVAIGVLQYSCLAGPFQELFQNCTGNRPVQYQRMTLKFTCAMDVLTDYLSESLSSKRSTCMASNNSSHGDPY